MLSNNMPVYVVIGKESGWVYTVFLIIVFLIIVFLFFQ